MLSIRLTPNARSSSTCSGAVSSGPRKRKFGKMVDTVKEGKGSSVVGGWSKSGRAVTGDGGNPTGVSGLRGLGKAAWEVDGERLSVEPLTARGKNRTDELPFLFEWASLRWDGELGRREDEDDWRLIVHVGAASVLDFEGTVRRVSLGTSLSAELVSSLRRFGMLDTLRALGRRGKTEEDGEGEGESS